MNSLHWRLLSASIALVLFSFILYFFNYLGLVAVSTVLIILALVEYSEIAFRRFGTPKSLQLWFMFVCLVYYVLGLLFPKRLDIEFGLAATLFFAFGMWLCRGRMANVRLLSALAMGCIGLVYCLALPLLAVQTLFMPNGVLWFIALLIVVFIGDTFAFFGGRLWGRHKLMPEVSPKKTLEGAAAGLLGSCLAGSIYFEIFLPEIPFISVFIYALASGFVAQNGDLFVSLLKRVAQVKDSGKLMPGHGGILDRLDGVFAASPLIYLFASFYTV